jgi:hypothetical protein
VHQELSEKQKPRTHQGGGLSPPAEILFSEFPHHTSSGTFVPDQGHLSSPLPGCQTRLRVIPDVGSDRTQPVSGCNKNLCHSRKPPPHRPSPLQGVGEMRACHFDEVFKKTRAVFIDSRMKPEMRGEIIGHPREVYRSWRAIRNSFYALPSDSEPK